MRAFLALLFCVALSTTASAADPYPSRPIRLLIPFPPAGITDLSGRIVAEGLRAKLGQPVVVENKPGANGVLGLRELLKADPDGYTLMVGNLGSLVHQLRHRHQGVVRSDEGRGADRRHRPNIRPRWWSTTRCR